MEKKIAFWVCVIDLNFTAHVVIWSCGKKTAACFYSPF